MEISDVLSALFGVIQSGVQTFMLYKVLHKTANKLLLFFFTALNCAAVIIPMPLYIGLPMSILCALLLVRFGFGGNLCQTILYGVLSSEIIWLSFGSLDALFSIFGAVTHIPVTPIGGVLFLVVGNILSLGAYWIISCAAFKIIRNEPAELQNVMMIIAPLILIFIVEIFIVKVMYQIADTSSLRNEDVELLIVQLLGNASVFCILLSYKRCAESFRLHEKLRLYDRERHYNEQYANDLKKYYNTAKSMKHDFKNHILIIGEMLQKERYQDAAGYVTKLNKECEYSELKFHTGSFILDIIFTEKLSSLIDKVTAKISAVPEIMETDICTIFGNAVDNAVHAVSKLPNDERSIVISTKKRGDMLFIEFENSYDGKPFKPSTGIENITAAAEKYGGLAKIITDNNRFVLRIILCNSQH